MSLPACLNLSFLSARCNDGWEIARYDVEHVEWLVGIIFSHVAVQWLEVVGEIGA